MSRAASCWGALSQSPFAIARGVSKGEGGVRAEPHSAEITRRRSPAGRQAALARSPWRRGRRRSPLSSSRSLGDELRKRGHQPFGRSSLGRRRKGGKRRGRGGAKGIRRDFAVVDSYPNATDL